MLVAKATAVAVAIKEGRGARKENRSKLKWNMVARTVPEMGQEDREAWGEVGLVVVMMAAGTDQGWKQAGARRQPRAPRMKGGMMLPRKTGLRHWGRGQRVLPCRILGIPATSRRWHRQRGRCGRHNNMFTNGGSKRPPEGDRSRLLRSQRHRQKHRLHPREDSTGRLSQATTFSMQWRTTIETSQANSGIGRSNECLLTWANMPLPQS